jgi:hypothetical protein
MRSNGVSEGRHRWVIAVALIPVFLGGQAIPIHLAGAQPNGTAPREPGAVAPATGHLHPDIWAGGNGWQNITVGEYGAMPARIGEAIAVDNPDNLDVFYGGEGAGGALSTDTWITDDATLENVSRGVGAVTPPPLVGASLTYDAATSTFVLFGGAGPGGRLSSDTWQFTPSTTRWSNISATAGLAPPAQTYAPMAYDHRDGYVVLQSSIGSHPLWTFAGGTWTNRNVTGPSLREGAAMLEDPQVASLILFGGSVGGSAMNDSWAFAAGAWTRLSLPHAPPRSSNGSLAYDPASGLLLQFGGSLSSDTWGYNGTDWSRLAVGGPLGPPPRIHAQMLYTSEGPFVEMFGGQTPSGGPLIEGFWAWNPIGPPGDPTTAAASIPSWVGELAVAAVAVPVLLALLFLRPPKTKPVDAPTTSRAPTAG